MAEITSIKTNENGLTTLTIEIAQEEILEPVIYQTIKLLATGLGNQLISEHMGQLTTLFTTKFRKVIVRVMEQSIDELNKSIDQALTEEE